MTKSSKLIVFSCGGKGGVGKTTVATAIADFYAAHDISTTLFDCDTENKQRGSLSHFFPTATKLDIRTERGLGDLTRPHRETLRGIGEGVWVSAASRVR